MTAIAVPAISVAVGRARGGMALGVDAGVRRGGVLGVARGRDRVQAVRRDRVRALGLRRVATAAVIAVMIAEGAVVVRRLHRRGRNRR